MGRRKINLDGKKFGRLLATNTLRAHGLKKGHERLCYCDCGNETWVQTNKLLTNHTQSCGCWLMEFKKLSPGRAVRNQVLDDYKRGAKNRNLSWCLSDIEFDKFISQNCYYCDRPPSTLRKARRMNGDLIYNGIDRLNNLIGYISENCVTCCQICNRAKSDLSLEDFMNWIKDLCGAYYDK